MSIYSKSVRLLMRDMATDFGLEKNKIFSKKEAIAWFQIKYPKIKIGTVSAHLIRLSTNAPSRIHYNAESGRDDLFFQIDGGHFRLFDPVTDPPPIDIARSSENENILDTDGKAEATEELHETTQPTAFAFESDLRNFLAKNLSLIEPNLKLYEEEGITGIEFPVGGRFIDILALDARNDYVVIELKVSRGYDRVVGQLLRYMAWIKKNQAESSQKVRGIIVAREITEDLLLACSEIPEVALYEYKLAVTLNPIKISS